MCEVAHTSGRSFCHQVQSQTSQVCVSSTGSAGLAVVCSRLKLGGARCLRFPSGISSGKAGHQDPRSGISKFDSLCPRVAQHALVLGSGQHFCAGTFLPATSREPVDPAIQLVSIQRSPTCLAPRASSIQAQGFSDEVATRIEAPQRQSTRAVYESKWAIFVKWCESNKVYFRSPSLSQIADFLLYLFREKHLQPGTIDRYRTAIADKTGNDRVNVSKDENLTRLLESFHRDKPKGLIGVPS